MKTRKSKQVATEQVDVGSGREATARTSVDYYPIVLSSDPASSGRRRKVVHPPVPPPDLQDVARRGGLENDILGYGFGSNWSLHSGNATSTFNSFLIRGFDKEIEDVHYYCASSAREVSTDEIRREYPNVAFLPDESLNAIKLSDQGLHGADVLRHLHEMEPKPSLWPPITEEDHRSHEVKQGEIGQDYYDELKRIDKACDKRAKNTDELRKQFPDFSVWEPISHLKENSYFKDIWKSRGRWKAGQMYDCIALLMNGRSGHGRSGSTVEKWCKAYRRWKRRTSPSQSS